MAEKPDTEAGKGIVKPTPLSQMVETIYEPTIQATYGMSFREFADYVEDHEGEMPPIPGGPFAGVPACWPHFHCDHP